MVLWPHKRYCGIVEKLTEKIVFVYTRVIPKVRSPKCWGPKETVSTALGNTMVCVTPGPTPTCTSLLCSILTQPSYLMDLMIDTDIKCEAHTVVQILRGKAIKLIEIHLQ